MSLIAITGPSCYPASCDNPIKTIVIVTTSHRSASVVINALQLNDITEHISDLQLHIKAVEGKSATGLLPR